jgi:phosphoribosylglycinamide formyltransferase 1
MKKIAIFASGTGSNALKIMEQAAIGTDMAVAVVIANKADAKVLDTAASRGIPTVVIGRDLLYGREAEMLAILRQYEVEWLILAGFLWLVPTYLLQAFPRRVINIHPALLPKFGGKGMYGMHVHEAVKASGEVETGITIHYANEHYDEGDVIFQAASPVDPADTPADIARKVQQLEHRHFPQIVHQLVTQTAS